jgi:hypothetical protein
MVRVEAGGALYSAQVGVRAPYDPTSSRVKAMSERVRRPGAGSAPLGEEVV